MNPMMCNGLTLAYIGDSYYELIIRRYLVLKGITKVNELHKNAIKYTSGEAQAKIIDYLLENNLLSDEEIAIFKKGRNSNVTQTRKHLDKADYLKATGFEALIGYLYLGSKEERINEIINIILDWV